MTTELLLILITAVLINNPVLYYFLGLCPYLGVSNKVDMAFGMGCAVTFVITVSGVVTWAIVHGILTPIGSAIGDPEALYFLKYVAFIMVIASMVQLVEMYLKKFFPPLYTAFGVFLPLITTNCAVMGVCLINVNEEYNFLQALVASFSYAVGFGLALILFAGVRERILLARVPRLLEDTSIALVTAGILSLTFFAFKGMV